MYLELVKSLARILRSISSEKMRNDRSIEKPTKRKTFFFFFFVRIQLERNDRRFRNESIIYQMIGLCIISLIDSLTEDCAPPRFTTKRSARSDVMDLSSTNRAKNKSRQVLPAISSTDVRLRHQLERINMTAS